MKQLTVRGKRNLQAALSMILGILTIFFFFMPIVSIEVSMNNGSGQYAFFTTNVSPFELLFGTEPSLYVNFGDVTELYIIDGERPYVKNFNSDWRNLSDPLFERGSPTSAQIFGGIAMFSVPAFLLALIISLFFTLLSKYKLHWQESDDKRLNAVGGNLARFLSCGDSVMGILSAAYFMIIGVCHRMLDLDLTQDVGTLAIFALRTLNRLWLEFMEYQISKDLKTQTDLSPEASVKSSPLRESTVLRCSIAFMVSSAVASFLMFLVVLIEEREMATTLFDSFAFIGCAILLAVLMIFPHGPMFLKYEKSIESSVFKRLYKGFDLAAAPMGILGALFFSAIISSFFRGKIGSEEITLACSLFVLAIYVGTFIYNFIAVDHSLRRISQMPVEEQQKVFFFKDACNTLDTNPSLGAQPREEMRTEDTVSANEEYKEDTVFFSKTGVEDKK